jgi:hypothetical protein
MQPNKIKGWAMGVLAAIMAGLVSLDGSGTLEVPDLVFKVLEGLNAFLLGWLMKSPLEPKAVEPPKP